MVDRVKLSVCCYCGSREAIRLGDAPRRKLACDACGAPLKQLKKLGSSAPAAKRRSGVAATPARLREAAASVKRRRVRKSKSLGRRLGAWLEDAFDEIEDLFD